MFRASIHGGYGRLLEVGSVVTESVPSWVVDLLSLAIYVLEEKSRAFILKLSVGGLESRLLSSNT